MTPGHGTAKSLMIIVIDLDGSAASVWRIGVYGFDRRHAPRVHARGRAVPKVSKAPTSGAAGPFGTFGTMAPRPACVKKPDSDNKLCLWTRLFPLASPAGLAGRTHASV